LGTGGASPVSRLPEEPALRQQSSDHSAPLLLGLAVRLTGRAAAAPRADTWRMLLLLLLLRAPGEHFTQTRHSCIRISCLLHRYTVSQETSTFRLRLTGEVDRSVGYSCQIFSAFNVPKIVKIG